METNGEISEGNFEELIEAKGYTDNVVRELMRRGKIPIADALHLMNKLYKVSTKEEYIDFCKELEKFTK